MSAVIIRADARHLPLPDASVDLIVTSPPYFSLRSYTDGGEHYAGQIGSEATPAEYVAALLECTREWVRVLKLSGSMFINLGDKYAGSIIGGDGARAKSLLSLPWRYALACTGGGTMLAGAQVVKALLRDVALGVLTLAQAESLADELAATPDPGLGLILRRDIIWHKTNGLPESVTDRCRSSHEYLFHFTRQPRYYSAVDEVREPQIAASIRRQNVPEAARVNGGRRLVGAQGLHDYVNPLGKLPGSVWSIPSQPLTVPARLGTDHFAAFPMELPRRVIAGWSPPGICTACGEGRRPVVDKRLGVDHWAANNRKRMDGLEPFGNDRGINADRRLRGFSEATITGYACACPQPDAPTRPATIADPFGGTGTTALVADALGRDGISFDRSADYCRLARWRTTDPGERAKAFQVPKPPPVPVGQGDLFAGPGGTT